MVGPGVSARVLVFPRPPAFYQVLKSAGLAPAANTSHAFVENGTRVLIRERGGNKTGVELKPMNAATALGLGRRVNINRLSAQDLTLLPGIGPKTAGRILAARQRRGPLNGVEDLLRIKGIGPEKIKKFGSFIVFAD